MQPSRKELENAERWDYKAGSLTNVIAIYVIPSNRKHDSGFYCMDFVAQRFESDGCSRYYRFGGGCDALHFRSSDVNIDCHPKNGFIRVYPGPTFFRIEGWASDIEVFDQSKVEGYFFGR